MLFRSINFLPPDINIIRSKGVLGFGGFGVLGVLYMRQMFSVSDRSGLQAGQFSIRTLLIPNHPVVIHAECALALSC